MVLVQWREALNIYMRTNWKHLDPFRRFNDDAFRSPMGATYGAFTIPSPTSQFRQLNIIATDGIDPNEQLMDIPEMTLARLWEHVSIHGVDTVFKKRFTPCWDEMCHIKDLFWNDDEVVVQYHPAKKDYVNINPFVLHLWRPTGATLPTPPIYCV